MKKIKFKYYYGINLTLLLLLMLAGSVSSQSLEDKVEWTIEFASHQMRSTLEEMNWDSTQHPEKTNVETGEWNFTSRKGWTSGFFSGSAWYLFELTNHDSTWLDVAKKWTGDLEAQKYETGSHDIGFQIF